MLLHLGGRLAHLSKGELRVDEHFGHHGNRSNAQGGKILFDKKCELHNPVSDSETQTLQTYININIFCNYSYSYYLEFKQRMEHARDV